MAQMVMAHQEGNCGSCPALVIPATYISILLASFPKRSWYILLYPRLQHHLSTPGSELTFTLLSYSTQHVCMHAKLLHSCPALCIPMDCSPPGSVHGILQARILEWVAMPSSRGSSQLRDQTRISYVPCIAGGFFTTSATWEAPPPPNTF